MTVSPDTRFEKHILVEEEKVTAVDLLANNTDLTKQRIKKVMQQGAVWLTRGKNTERLRRATRALKQGDTVHLYYDPAVLGQVPNNPQLIADKGGYSIWYKPFGVLCQGSKWGDHCTINRWVESNQFKDRPSIIVHRLDRATTGLMILVHTKAMARQFTILFQERGITKRYWALVEGEFPSKPEITTINTPIQDRSAISHAKRLEFNADIAQSLVEISIETGRKHQIRQHLSSIGWPIVGDRRYGAKNTESDLKLSAVYLAFHCPIDDKPIEYLLPKKLLIGLERT